MTPRTRARFSLVARSSVLVASAVASIATVGVSEGSWELFERADKDDRPTITLSALLPTWSDVFRVTGRGTNRGDTIGTVELFVAVEASVEPAGSTPVPLTLRFVPSNNTLPVQETSFATYGSPQYVYVSTEIECTSDPCQIEGTVEIGLDEPSSLGGRTVSVEWAVTGYARGAGKTPPTDADVILRNL